jgi:hypothetical protein
VWSLALRRDGTEGLHENSCLSKWERRCTSVTDISANVPQRFERREGVNGAIHERCNIALRMNIYGTICFRSLCGLCIKTYTVKVYSPHFLSACIICRIVWCWRPTKMIVERISFVPLQQLLKRKLILNFEFLMLQEKPSSCSM